MSRTLTDMRSEAPEPADVRWHGSAALHRSRTYLASAAPWVALAAAILLACWLASSGLGDEGRTGAGDDASRYAMNGVYFYDLLHDRPFGSLEELVAYTRYYYARYPALSLGHHPVLLSALAVPAFAIGGISLTAARAVVMVFFVLAVGFTWALVRRKHGDWPAAAAALLVATNPYLVQSSQIVMAEIPALALLLATAFFLQRFCDRQRRSDLALLVTAAALALYAKQLSAFAFPGFAAYAWLRLGWRRILRRDVIVGAAVFSLLIVPLVPMTLMLAKANIGFVRAQVTGGHGPHAPAWLHGRVTAVREAFAAQITLPVLLAIAVSAAVAGARRDRRVLIYVVWFLSVLGCIVGVTGTIEPTRMSVYWLPALLALAATLAGRARGTLSGAAMVSCLLAAVAYQASVGARTAAVTTRGYEAAAQVVARQPHAATVMFSGEIDSGLFVLFMRKHDPTRSQIVLRADKIFTTSYMMRSSIEERIASPDEIYPKLQEYGTRYVVVEDRPTQSQALRWLREAVHTDRFRELYHGPLVSDDPRLRNASIGVYEFLDARDPAPDAVLDMKLALIGQQLDIPLRELLERRYLR